MVDIKTNEPFVNIWFGNFYKPAYDDKGFIDSEIKELKRLGFNGVQLDTKAWEDFAERFSGGEASRYVEQQEYMMKVCLENGISYNFLTLYLCADNLYPNIRFSPPIFGESVTNADGSDGRWYKYWSEKAKRSMIKHVKGVFETYGRDVSRVKANGREVKPTCTMWDPIVAPSFDDEGRARYLNWLSRRYGCIDAFNAEYGTEFSDFSELRKEDYWFSCAYPEDGLYTKAELDERSPKARMWADNMRWRAEELCEYFRDMQERIHDIDPAICTVPDMAQWSYFLNIDASELSNVGLADLWDTSNRGIDIYSLSKYVDCCNFITVPITPLGDPDAYVSACQHAMMRAMNRGREFLGGIYWGRFLYNDIYAYLTPSEIVGSIAASGAAGYTSYGVNGLDDGGVMHRMDKGFCDSLAAANNGFKKIVQKLGKRRTPEIAILFPNAMSLYEPMGVEGNKERRYDLLGWYKMCLDGGFDCDVIDEGMIREGMLSDYKVLIAPENDCRFMDDNKAANAAIENWVKNGGIYIHSPMDNIAKTVFGIKGMCHGGGAFMYTEKGLSQSDVYCSYEGEKLASYLADGSGAAVKNVVGDGTVYSFGFAYGYSYTAKIAPHVPLSEKNNELYPVKLMKDNILWDILAGCGLHRAEFYGKGIETAEFENGVVVVNHTSYAVDANIGETAFRLAPRGSAAVIGTELTEF